MMVKTQVDKMILHMETQYLTNLDAFKLYGVLGGFTRRISDIRELLIGTNLEVRWEWVKLANGKRVKQYWIGKIKQ